MDGWMKVISSYKYVNKKLKNITLFLKSRDLFLITCDGYM